MGIPGLPDHGPFHRFRCRDPSGAQGGTRTLTPQGQRILNPPRLPFRHLSKRAPGRSRGTRGRSKWFPTESTTCSFSGFPATIRGIGAVAKPFRIRLLPGAGWESNPLEGGALEARSLMTWIPGNNDKLPSRLEGLTAEDEQENLRCSERESNPHGHCGPPGFEPGASANSSHPSKLGKDRQERVFDGRWTSADWPRALRRGFCTIESLDGCIQNAMSKKPRDSHHV